MLYALLAAGLLLLHPHHHKSAPAPFVLVRGTTTLKMRFNVDGVFVTQAEWNKALPSCKELDGQFSPVPDEDDGLAMTIVCETKP